MANWQELSEPVETNFWETLSEPVPPAEEFAQMSVPRKAISAAVGAVEAGVVQPLTSIYAASEAGLRGLAELAITRDIDKAAEIVRNISEKRTYAPRSSAGKIFAEALAKAFEFVRDETGEFVEKAAEGVNVASRELLGKEILTPSASGRTAGEVSFDIATLGLPSIALGKGISRGIRSAKQARELEKQVQELEQQKQQQQQAYEQAVKQVKPELEKWRELSEVIDIEQQFAEKQPGLFDFVSMEEIAKMRDKAIKETTGQEAFPFYEETARRLIDKETAEAEAVQRLKQQTFERTAETKAELPPLEMEKSVAKQMGILELPRERSQDARRLIALGLEEDHPLVKSVDVSSFLIEKTAELPEALLRNTTMKNIVSQINETKTEINRLVDKIGERYQQGIIQRQGDLFVTRKAQSDIDKIVNQISDKKQQLDSLTQKLQKTLQTTYERKGRLPKVPGKQRGAIDPELMTLGLSRIISPKTPGKNVLPDSLVPERANEATRTKIGSVIAKVTALASGETRKWTDVPLPDNKQEVVDLKGLPDKAQYMSNASFMEHFSWDKTTSTAISWVRDRIGEIVKKGELEASVIKTGGPFNIKGATDLFRNKPKEDSPMFLWSALDHHEKSALREVAARFNGVKDPTVFELKDMGLSDKAIKAYQTMRDALERVRESVNELRAQHNLPPIPALPGYFPKMRKGNFVVSAKDAKTLEPIWVQFTKTKLGGNWVKSRLEELAKQNNIRDIIIEVKELDTSTVKSGNPYNIGIIQFTEALRILSKDDPRTKALESLMREVRSKRGFGRHKIERKTKTGVGGAMGDELRMFEWSNNKSFWDSFEMYVNQGIKYKTNLEIDLAIADFLNDPRLVEAPKLRHWAENYARLAKGNFEPGEIARLIETMAGWIIKGVTFKQLSGNEARAIIHGLNKFFLHTALFFYNLPFLAGQLIQPEMFASQYLMFIKQKGNLPSSVSQAMVNGEMEAIRFIGGSKANKEFVSLINDYLAPRQVINPGLSHLLDFMGTLQNVGSTSKVMYNFVSGIWLVQGLETFARVRTAGIAYHFWKQAGLSGKQLKLAIERTVNDIMVDYSNYSERPSIVQRTGIVGEAAGPLSTFATNFWSNTIAYMKLISEKPANIASYKPFATHLAMTAVFGGLTGMLFVHEVDLLIELLKKIGAIDPDVPTATEAILTTPEIDNIAAYGITGATGVNLFTTMASPEIRGPSANTFPGLNKAIRIITAMGEIAKQKGQGLPMTHAQIQQLLNEIVPTTARGFVERFTSPDVKIPYDLLKDGRIIEAIFETRKQLHQPGIVQDPKRRGFGLTERTTTERRLGLVGLRSLEEERELTAGRLAQKKLETLREKQIRLVDAVVDSIMTNNDINWDNVIEQAAKLEITPDQLIDHIVRTYKNRLLTREERMIGVVPETPRQMMTYEQFQAMKQQYARP